MSSLTDDARMDVHRMFTGGRERRMRDGLWVWVLATDLSDADIACFTRFRKSVIARIEILALLQLVLKQVLLVRKFAIQSEKLLFFWRHGLQVKSVRYYDMHTILRLTLISTLFF